MDRRESLYGNLDACIKSALPLPLIKECQYLALTPFPIPRSGSGRERRAPNETDCTQSNRCKPVKSVSYQDRNQKDHSAGCDDPGRPRIGPSPVRSPCLGFSMAQGNEGEATKTVVGRQKE